MSNASVKKFQDSLLSANGDKVKMIKAFKSISSYLGVSLLKKGTGQNLDDYLNQNPRIKKIHEWSGTVMVDSKYELVNY